jgi:DNA-binding MarR family transcriptional regulator
MMREPSAQSNAEPQAEPRFVDHYLAYLLAQASNRVSREFHLEAAEAGLSVTEWRVLASLDGSEGENIGELSQLTLTKQPTLSRVVQRMEANGLLCRKRVKRDRRQSLMCLTERGEALMKELKERALSHQQRVLEPFGQDKALMLITMLKELLALRPPAEHDDETLEE